MAKCRPSWACRAHPAQKAAGAGSRAQEFVVRHVALRRPLRGWRCGRGRDKHHCCRRVRGGGGSGSSGAEWRKRMASTFLVPRPEFVALQLARSRSGSWPTVCLRECHGGTADGPCSCVRRCVRRRGRSWSAERQRTLSTFAAAVAAVVPRSLARIALAAVAVATRFHQQQPSSQQASAPIF